MKIPKDLPFPERSVDPCPHCGRHELALTQPPEIPVMGAQPYTAIYRMGDVASPVGVRCRACGMTWPTIEAQRAGEPGMPGEIDPVDGLEEAGEEVAEPPTDAVDAPGPSVRAPGQRRQPWWVLLGSVALVVVLAGSFFVGLFIPVAILLMAAALVVRFLLRGRQDRA
ncbi:MAG: hypothetical protein U0869_00700 [Chloroflexota bacterium]